MVGSIQAQNNIEKRIFLTLRYEQLIRYDGDSWIKRPDQSNFIL